MHRAPFRRLQGALNSSHQSVKLLLDQGSPAIKPIFLAVLGAWSGHAKPDLRLHALPEGSWDVRVRRVEAAEWLGRAVIHHVTIFFVESGEPVRR